MYNDSKIKLGQKNDMIIKIEDIFSNPNQVRQIALNAELEELAESIGEHGLLQPIKVRPNNGKYELIYGHRRLAAMRMLNWVECEALVAGVSDEDSLNQSIAENLQRQDLDVIDEAKSYQLLRNRGYTINEIARIVKKPQGRISNRLSILRLPPEVQALVQTKKSQHAATTEMGGLSADSASRISSATVSDAEAITVANKAVNENLNSREIRELTSLLKEIDSEVNRRRIVERPWQSSRNDYQQTSIQVRPQSVAVKPPSISELIHYKFVWNLERLSIGEFDHFTIGYSERSINQFLELLRLAKVDLLADVRRNPVSRYRPEFSKSNLKKNVNEVDIEYVHWPELGIPSEQRRNIRTEELFDWYDANIKPGVILEQFEEVLGDNRTAFMCVEMDPQSCHRHRISVSLEKGGLKLLDL